MSTISSLGIGSGLDVESMVSKLVALEQKPLEQLQKTASSLQTKLSAFSQLKSQISNLSDQLTALTSTNTWDAMKLTSSSTAITGSATNAASATSFSMKVTQLAQAQAAGSVSITAGSAVGGGTLTIALGTWSGSGFTTGSTATPGFAQGSATPISVSISATDTLSQVATKINNANAGVKATVLKDASGERLLLQSSSTGESTEFKITAADDDGNPTDNSGLSRLAFDPSATSIYGMSLTQAGKNAEATIYGVAVTSNTNTFSEVITGVSLTVSDVTSTAANITVAGDQSTARTSLSNFVTSYNTLVQTLAEMTKYNPSDKTAGTLQGDSTAVGLLNAFRQLVGKTGPAGNAFGRLSDVGLEIQTDGTLKINDTKLSAAFNKGADLKSFFTTDNGTNSNATNGLAVQIKAFTTGLLSTDGLFASKASSITSQQKRNTDDQQRVNDRVSLFETRLRAQYSRLDATMAQMTALSTYVSQQVTAWNKNSSN